MKVGIVHNSLNPTGGGERVCLSTVDALQQAGHHVTLATCDHTDWPRVHRSFGVSTRPDEERQFVPVRLPVFGIYQRLLSTVMVERLRKSCDVVVNTHGDMVPIPCHVTYMHFPTFLMNQEIYSPVNIKYRRSLVWRTYFLPYMYLQVRLIKRYTRSGTILTNSEFSRKVILDTIGRVARVVYPPVNVDAFLRLPEEPREDVVVSCARIAPEKRLHLIPRVAKELPDVQFYIVGSTSYVSAPVLKRIAEEVQRCDVQNVRVLTNFSFQVLLDLYTRAKVYLHMMDNEHFGIAPVEAMAAGLIPVVHQSGGPWLDILEEGKYGYGWSTLAEAVDGVRRGLEASDAFRSHVREKAKAYGEHVFQQSMVEVLEAACAHAS